MATNNIKLQVDTRIDDTAFKTLPAKAQDAARGASDAVAKKPIKVAVAVDKAAMKASVKEIEGKISDLTKKRELIIESGKSTDKTKKQLAALDKKVSALTEKRRELKIEMRQQTYTQLKTRLESLNKSVNRIALGAAAVGTAFILAARRIATGLDEIDKGSQRLGLSRQAFQELSYVMNQTGTNIQSMELGMRRLSQMIQKDQTVFKQLGIDIKDANGAFLSQGQILQNTIRQLQRMPPTMQRAAAANELLGRAAVELEPLFNAGAGAMDELIDRAHRMGFILDDTAIDAGVRLNDAFTDLRKSTGALMAQAFLPLIESMTTFINQIVNFIARNQYLARTIGEVVRVVGALAAGLLVVVSAIKGATIAMRIFNATLKMNPIGLIIGLVGTLATALGVLSRRNREVAHNTNDMAEAQRIFAKQMDEQRRALDAMQRAQDKLTERRRLDMNIQREIFRLAPTMGRITIRNIEDEKKAIRARMELRQQEHDAHMARLRAQQSQEQRQELDANVERARLAAQAQIAFAREVERVRTNLARETIDIERELGAEKKRIQIETKQAELNAILSIAQAEVAAQGRMSDATERRFIETATAAKELERALEEINRQGEHWGKNSAIWFTDNITPVLDGINQSFDRFNSFMRQGTENRLAAELRVHEASVAALDAAHAEKMAIIESELLQYEDVNRNIEIEQRRHNREMLGLQNELQGAMSQAQRDEIQARIDAEMAANQQEMDLLLQQEQERLDLEQARIDAEEYQAKKREQIEQEFAIRTAKIRRKQAQMDRKIAMAQATIDTASGIMRAWSKGPILGPILSALVAAAGAFQKATIMRTPLPEIPTFHKGGVIGKANETAYRGIVAPAGNPYDKTLMWGQQGERVLTKRDNRLFERLGLADGGLQRLFDRANNPPHASSSTDNSRKVEANITMVAKEVPTFAQAKREIKTQLSRVARGL